MYITVDIGGTNTRVAGASELAKPEFNKVLKHKDTTYADDLKFIIEAAKEICDGQLVRAVGIGIAGTVSADRTGVFRAPNKPEWNDKSFVTMIADNLNCPVEIDNDAATAGLGEYYYGTNRGSEFYYLIWGTGVGGATVEKMGDKVKATEIDRNQYFLDWEMDCGGHRLIEKFGKSPKDFTASEWAAVQKMFTDHLQKFVAAVRPPAIVFGGGFAIHHPDVILKAAKVLGILVSITKFGDDAGLYGGLGLIRQGIIAA